LYLVYFNMAPETLTLSATPPPGLDGLRKLYHATEPQHQIIRPNDTKHEPDEQLVRPSIKFEPVWEDYQARSAKIRASLKDDVKLPDGFPVQIPGKRTWNGKEIGGVDAFAVELSDAEIAEVEAALKYFHGGYSLVHTTIPYQRLIYANRTSWEQRPRSDVQGAVSAAHAW
jgi:hypothetical protein